MTNHRPSRPSHSVPKYQSSSTSVSDADERMGNVGQQVTTGNKVSRLATDKFYHGETFKSGNTRVVAHGDASVSLVLYDTAIATKTKDGIITLNSGGYRTATTKERLNSVLSPIGANITQRKGVWGITSSDGVERKFSDGIAVNSSGKFVPYEPTQSQRERNENESMRQSGKLISKTEAKRIERKNTQEPPRYQSDIDDAYDHNL